MVKVGGEVSNHVTGDQQVKWTNCQQKAKVTQVPERRKWRVMWKCVQVTGFIRIRVKQSKHGAQRNKAKSTRRRKGYRAPRIAKWEQASQGPNGNHIADFSSTRLLFLSPHPRPHIPPIPPPPPSRPLVCMYAYLMSLSALFSFPVRDAGQCCLHGSHCPEAVCRWVRGGIKRRTHPHSACKSLRKVLFGPGPQVMVESPFPFWPVLLEVQFFRAFPGQAGQ